MLTEDDLQSFRGTTIIDACIVERGAGQVLRLRLADGAILAIEGNDLNVADETSIPWD